MVKGSQVVERCLDPTGARAESVDFWQQELFDGPKARRDRAKSN
jgi:hypothetical protein